MKVNVDKAPILPVTIVLETQEEINQLFAVLNFVPVSRTTLNSDNWRQLYTKLDLQKDSDYIKYHNRLDKSYK